VFDGRCSRREKENMDADKLEKYFKVNERGKRLSILTLMNEWKAEILKCQPILFHDDNKLYKAIDYFGMDGFFPNYFNQKTKVLFIGRESRYNSGNDSVLGTLDYFNNTTNINASTFFRRILYITYGIRNNGKISFQDIPCANEIVEEMVKTNNFGFALINISKYSNDRKDGAKADVKLINRFLEDSKLDVRNFILEEIELLEPDIIITANLWDGKIENKYLSVIFPNILLKSSMDNKLNYYEMKHNNRLLKIVDLWHFSMPGSDDDYFYNPVIELLNKECFFK
jgi:hypothetical protein